MEDLIHEIEAALDAGFWRLALFGALALPDICAALDSEDGHTTGKKYAAWVDTWLKAWYQDIDGFELYKMRCGFLHRAQTGTRKYDRVIFTLPDTANLVHNNVVDDALNLDLKIFCSDVITAVRHWYESHSEKKHVMANMRDLVRLYPNGLAPYISGIPAIS